MTRGRRRSGGFDCSYHSLDENENGWSKEKIKGRFFFFFLVLIKRTIAGIRFAFS